MLLVMLGGPAIGGEDDGKGFPRGLVEWTPIAANPVFQGAGDDAWDRKIRERGYILVEDGTYHLWYTGYNDDRRQDDVARPRDLARRPALDPRPGEPDLRRVVGRGRLRRPPATAGSSCSPRGRETSRTSSPRPTASTGTTRGRSTSARPTARPISPGPYGTPTAWFEDGTWYLFYERGDQGVWLATSKDRRVWTNVQDAPVLAMGPEPYDRYAVAMNQVIKRDGVYYAFYHANATRSPGRTGPPASPARATWSTGRNIPATRSSPTTARAPSSSSTPQGDRLYTMHPDVKVFVNAAPAGSR